MRRRILILFAVALSLMCCVGPESTESNDGTVKDDTTSADASVDKCIADCKQSDHPGCERTCSAAEEPSCAVAAPGLR